MSKKPFITEMYVTYVNDRLYVAKVEYRSGVKRVYKAPFIPKTVVDYVKFWSPEMPDSTYDQLGVYCNE